MSWSLHRWVWQLDAPLFIGMPPAGTLNRCRLHVLARSIWAALTAELAQRQTRDFPQYDDVGQRLKDYARFTYLYPAEKSAEGWLAWLPCYKTTRGLVWQREDCRDVAGGLSDREMRNRVLDARPGTAIDSSSVTAADGTLREIDCINTRWRNPLAGPVGFAGYVLCRCDAVLKALSETGSLSLGGDTRYGLGRMRLIEWTEASNVFRKPVTRDTNIPCIRSSVVFAHAFQHGGELQMVGALELLVGWGRDRAGRTGMKRLHDKPLWTPGSLIPDSTAEREWEITDNGHWKLKTATPETASA